MVEDFLLGTVFFLHSPQTVKDIGDDSFFLEKIRGSLIPP